MKLTDAEASFLLESAQVSMMEMATTSPAMKEILKQRLGPAVRQVREAREDGSKGGGVGAPPDQA
jgi:hypothetical protein